MSIFFIVLFDKKHYIISVITFLGVCPPIFGKRLKRNLDQFEVKTIMKKELWLFFLVLLPVLLSAQTAVEIEELLAVKAVSYEQAARLVLKAADLPVFSAAASLPSGQEAFNYAAERKWLPKKAVIGQEASLEGVSLLIMRSFEIKGGLFYSLFKNPHYAYREMIYQDIIQGRADPQMAVSGEQLLFLINRLMSTLGNDSNYDVET